MVIFSLVASMCQCARRTDMWPKRCKLLSDRDKGSSYIGRREWLWIYLVIASVKTGMSCSAVRTCFPLLGGHWDFQRLDWAAGLKVNGGNNNNPSLWQMRLDGCHLSPADHAGRDICSTREMRSLMAFQRPAVSASLLTLSPSSLSHTSPMPLTGHELTCSCLHLMHLSGHYKTTDA